MQEIVPLLAQVAVLAVATVAALGGIALGTRALWRLTTRVKPRDSLAVSPSDFHRLETAVEAIAIEVERISEAQRFSAALLNQRIPARDAERRDLASEPAPLPRQNTPG
jgi:hypothetical protein